MKKEEDYKLVADGEKKYDINKCSVGELLDLKECADIVYNYYDNLVRSSVGNYPNGMNSFEDYTEKLRLYASIREGIFKRINKIVDNISQ